MANEHQFSLFAAELCSLGGTLTLTFCKWNWSIIHGLANWVL